MTQEHQVTPTPELVRQWSISGEGDEFVIENWTHIATQAARWGADQELEACCKLLELSDSSTREFLTREFLTAARRPKPPSLKEQSLEALYRFGDMEGHESLEQFAEDFAIIRRALEQLPDDQG